MRVAVLSGKGGTGKTFVSVNLAAVAGGRIDMPGGVVYVDCDVEEPNGRLFLKPTGVRTEAVGVRVPVFDADRCTGCRACVDFCHFNALLFLGDRPSVFTEICHSCGGCTLVCPTGAVDEEERPVGVVEEGERGPIHTVTGVLNVGEASGVPVIRAATKAGFDRNAPLTVVDCPPGSSCPVMESVLEADYCVLVSEATAFGFHNFKMVHELVHVLGKPCGVVINKADVTYRELEEYCREHDLPVLARIPYSERVADEVAHGKVASEIDPKCSETFDALLDALYEDALRRSCAAERGEVRP